MIEWKPNLQPVYETTETFQQLVNKLNVGAEDLDSDLSYLDSAIGPLSGGSTFSLSGLSTTAKSLIDAIRELDEDLHGAGGGTFSTETNTQEKNVVGAINEIEGVFDASTGYITTTAGLTATSQGDVSFTTTGDFLIDAEGDITLDANGNDISMRDGNERRLGFALGATNLLTATGNFAIDTSGRLVFTAVDGDLRLSNGVVDGDGIVNGVVYTTINSVTNEHKVSTPTHTTLKSLGNIYLSPTGTGADQTEGYLKITDSDESTIFDFKVDDAAQIVINGTSAEIQNTSGPLEVRSAGSIKLRSGTGVIKLDINGTRLAKFGEDTGHLMISSGSDDEQALLFSTGTVPEDGNANATFFGSITLPSSSTGSITSTEITANTVHGAIDELNARIPNVYDRNGTRLND